MSLYNVDKLMSEARRLAAEYRGATGKSLPISGEIARHDVMRLMNLQPSAEEEGGYDAVDADGRRIQIKGRAVFESSRSGQRIGQLRLEQEWDAVMLLIMDEAYEPVEILEADREQLQQALADAGSSRKNRGAMTLARFRAIARLCWTRQEGQVQDGESAY